MNPHLTTAAHALIGQQLGQPWPALRAAAHGAPDTETLLDSLERAAQRFLTADADLYAAVNDADRALARIRATLRADGHPQPEPAITEVAELLARRQRLHDTFTAAAAHATDLTGHTTTGQSAHANPALAALTA